jgi:phosphodiesterase/alkaline phosphatase D-like protein
MTHLKFAASVLALSSVLAGHASAAPLLNGVASGDVGQSQATLWARANTVGAVPFEYSSTPSFNGGTLGVVANVVDQTAPAKVTVNGLQANTRYYYRATDAGGNVSEGTFKTAAASGANGLRFGVSGDWRGELAPFPAVANADERSLDFFLKLGDTIYAD